MGWVKVDDNMFQNAKIHGVSYRARWVYVASIQYASANLTDGFISKNVLRLIDANQRIAEELASAGLWENVDGGWSIHDYLRHNRSREDIEERRSVNKRNASKSQSESLANRSPSRQANRRQIASRAYAGPRDQEPDPDPETEDSPSGNPESDGKSHDDDPADVREICLTVLNSLPAKQQADPLTFDEAKQLGWDYRGQQKEIAAAIAQCRRDNTLPFPQRVRKYMPKPPPSQTANGKQNGYYIRPPDMIVS